MPYIQPTFYTDTKLWETDQLIEGEVLTAKSLRELQTQLIKIHPTLRVKGYYPSGFGNVVKPRTSPNAAKVSMTGFQGRGYQRVAPKPKLTVSVEVPTDQLMLDLPNPLQDKKPEEVFDAPDIQPEVEFPKELRAPGEVKRKPDPIAVAALRKNTVVSWISENDEKLMKLFWGGLGATGIARQLSESLGVTVTKNSVIGRLHRLGYQLSQRD
jgi:hypothetical protein